MSLVSDPQYLIHSLRLQYLRNVEDPYGPRMISLNPSYTSNPYILAASLADAERWPELILPASPEPSDDERGPTGFPAATRLKYSQTIMGPSRHGGMGLRTSAKRASLAMKRGAVTITEPSTTEAAEGSKPIPTPEPEVKAVLETTPVPPVEVSKEVQFIPRFKGAAEMEARRRVRMAARAPPAIEVKPATPAEVYINPELSSSDEDEAELLVDEDSDFDDVGADSSMDEDEFDPEFAATRTPGGDGDSFTSPPADGRSGRPVHRRVGDSVFEIVNPPAPSRAVSQTRAKPIPPLLPPSLSYARRKVAPIKPMQSALTSMIAAASGSSNPFSELYSAISGRGETSSTNVSVFFPGAKEPRGKGMDLNVRKDASVEEVVGFALWTYWDKGWLPKLDAGLGSEDDPKRATKLTAVGWTMRIAEDDGELDDDFPPPDRTGKISKFNFDAYAVLEATPAQVQQNQTIEAKIQRRPSRIMAQKPKESAPLALPVVFGPSTSAFGSSALGSFPLSTSLTSTNRGPQLFLRIRVADTTEQHISTTIPVSAGMYMQEALELVCRRRKLPNAKDYALLMPVDARTNILIPLDRTVASLQGKRELLLALRDKLPGMGIDLAKGAGKTTDPNASIFKRSSDVPAEAKTSAMDPRSAYKKYTIYRKMPMLVARQERTMAIDGVYIHIMPTVNRARAVFESGRTASYHISRIAACQKSTKSSSIFKLVVLRDGVNKRYDFEAESPKLANEIVQAVRALKQSLEKSGTTRRKSRHIS